MSAASGFVQIQRRNHFAYSGHFRSSDGIELSLAQSIGHYVIGCRINAESIRLAGFVRLTWLRKRGCHSVKSLFVRNSTREALL